MSDPRPPTPTEEAEAALERYRQATQLHHRDDLVSRIHQRLADEPVSTAPRRFVAALRAFDVRGMWRGFRESVGVLVSPRTRSLLVRAQALAVTVAVVLGITLGSIVAVAAADRVIAEVQTLRQGERDRKPTPKRSPAATTEASRAATTPVPQAATPDVSPSGRPAGAIGPVLPETASDKARNAPHGNKAPSAPKSNAKAPSAPKSNAKAPSAPKSNAKAPSGPNPAAGQPEDNRPNAASAERDDRRGAR